MVKAVLKGWDLWVAVAGALLVSMSFECSGVMFQKMPLFYFAGTITMTVAFVWILAELKKDIEFSGYLEKLGIENKFWWLFGYWYLLTFLMVLFYNAGWKTAVIFTELYIIFYAISMYHIISLLPYYRKKYRQIICVRKKEGER